MSSLKHGNEIEVGKNIYNFQEILRTVSFGERKAPENVNFKLVM